MTEEHYFRYRTLREEKNEVAKCVKFLKGEYKVKVSIAQAVVDATRTEFFDIPESIRASLTAYFEAKLEDIINEMNRL